MAPRVRKADRVGHNNIDRISDLPVNIIECILCHLPIRDVVRTSILSRKWRYMWVSIPQLEFGEDFFYACHMRNIGDQVPGIITVLCIEHLEDFESICFKKAKNLTDLTLQIESGAGFIPQLLQDSITSLKYLELDGVDFNKPKMLLFMAALLKSSPNLVELDIRSGGSLGWSVAPLPNHQRAVDCYNSFCLSQLQKVNITVRTANEHALDLTRFLLANSPSLEILTFEVWPWLGRKHYEKLLTISQDLLRLGRASPRAEVKFLYS